MNSATLSTVHPGECKCHWFLSSTHSWEPLRSQLSLLIFPLDTIIPSANIYNCHLSSPIKSGKCTHSRTLFIIGCTGKGGWQHTPDTLIYLASHRRVSILLWQEDHDCLSTREEGREREREKRQNSRFNKGTDKKSEWIQPTWAPLPGSPYLLFAFLITPLPHTHVHPPFGIANQPMCFFYRRVMR